VEEIRADMVANVVRLIVAPGDLVASGETLIMLESMKMEIPVLTEDGGIVDQLAVREGDVIQQGDLIAMIR
jgi:acetyl-CoA carboxylase biotin carboxyl carrier protein